MSDKPFDPAKPVRTRDGRVARIVCTDSKSKFGPIVALVGPDDESQFYQSNGHYLADSPHYYDLINVEPRVEEYYDVWDGLTHGPYTSYYKATRFVPGMAKRLCILKVVREGDKIISREVVND